MADEDGMAVGSFIQIVAIRMAAELDIVVARSADQFSVLGSVRFGLQHGD